MLSLTSEALRADDGRLSVYLILKYGFYYLSPYYLLSEGVKACLNRQGKAIQSTPETD